MHNTSDCTEDCLDSAFFKMTESNTALKSAVLCAERVMVELPDHNAHSPLLHRRACAEGGRAECGWDANAKQRLLWPAEPPCFTKANGEQMEWDSMQKLDSAGAPLFACVDSEDSDDSEDSEDSEGGEGSGLESGNDGDGDGSDEGSGTGGGCSDGEGTSEEMAEETDAEADDGDENDTEADNDDEVEGHREYSDDDVDADALNAASVIMGGGGDSAQSKNSIADAAAKPKRPVRKAMQTVHGKQKTFVDHFMTQAEVYYPHSRRCRSSNINMERRLRLREPWEVIIETDFSNNFEFRPEDAECCKFYQQAAIVPFYVYYTDKAGINRKEVHICCSSDLRNNFDVYQHVLREIMDVRILPNMDAPPDRLTIVTDNCRSGLRRGLCGRLPLAR